MEKEKTARVAQSMALAALATAFMFMLIPALIHPPEFSEVRRNPVTATPPPAWAVQAARDPHPPETTSGRR